MINNEIIRLREEIVKFSNDPIQTRSLLDQLTDEIETQHAIDAYIHVDKKDVVSEKDKEIYRIIETTNSHILQYKGGYTIIADNQMTVPVQAMSLLMEDIPADITDEEKEYAEIGQSAYEMVFRLPTFVFSHATTAINIATMAMQYLSLLQKMGEVPTEETENPEFDKFILQMNELMENFAVGLEKEGKEYEKRMGINYGKDEKKAVESGSKTKSKGRKTRNA